MKIVSITKTATPATTDTNNTTDPDDLYSSVKEIKPYPYDKVHKLKGAMMTAIVG